MDTFIPAIDMSKLRAQLGGPIATLQKFELAVYKHYRQHALTHDHKLTRQRQSEGGSRAIVDILKESTDPPGTPPMNLVRIVKGFMTVENLLPDYIREILMLVRESKGRAMFMGFWGWEESLHGLALSEWLIRRNALTLPDSLALYERTIEKPWNPKGIDPAFEDPFHGLFYTTEQEKRTANAYHLLAQYAKRHTETALERICRRLASEETGHHAFYLELVKLALRFDPAMMIPVIYNAHARFQMPGAYADLPSYTRWTAIAVNEGIVPHPQHNEHERILATPPTSEETSHRLACAKLHVRTIGGIFDQLYLPRPNDLIWPLPLTS